MEMAPKPKSPILAPPTSRASEPTETDTGPQQMHDILITLLGDDMILLPQTDRARRWCEWFLHGAPRRAGGYPVHRHPSAPFRQRDFALFYARRAGLTLEWKQRRHRPARSRRPARRPDAESRRPERD